MLQHTSGRRRARTPMFRQTLFRFGQRFGQAAQHDDVACAQFSRRIGLDAANAVPADRRHTLIATHEETEGAALYRFDIHMQGEDETVFFDV